MLELKEVLDIKYTDYSLVYVGEDPKNVGKCMAFDNSVNMNLHSAWNLFGDIVTTESDEINSIVIPKERIFIDCASDIGSLQLQRSLLISYKTDFNLVECREKLILLRNGHYNSDRVDSFDNIKVVVNC